MGLSLRSSLLPPLILYICRPLLGIYSILSIRSHLSIYLFDLFYLLYLFDLFYLSYLLYLFHIFYLFYLSHLSRWLCPCEYGKTLHCRRVRKVFIFLLFFLFFLFSLFFLFFLFPLLSPLPFFLSTSKKPQNVTEKGVLKLLFYFSFW